MKKVSALLITLFISLTGFNIQTNASIQLPINFHTNIEEFENKYYFETTIEENKIPLSKSYSTQAKTKYITKTKTTCMKNQNGIVIWSVSIKATFSYNGTTSKCISYSHSTTCPAKAWTIKSCTSNKDKNSATAKAIAVHTDSTGASQSITKSVTIKCSPTGKVS